MSARRAYFGFESGLVCLLASVSVLAITPSKALAQESAANRVEFRGLLETSAAVETGDGRLQKWDLIVKPEARVRLTDDLRLTALGRMRLDPVDDLEPGQPDGQDAFRSPVSRRLFIGDAADLELREFYLDANVGDAFLRLGKQQIVWGQADGLRVLDIVNPFDFREFILPEFEDRRIPLWTVNAEVPLGDWTAQFLWIPDHSYDEIPDEGATFAFSSPRVVPRPNPAAIGAVPVIVNRPNRPNRFIRDDDYGARLTAFLSGWDVSLNYLYHYQDQPVQFQRRLPGGGVAIEPEYRRTHLIGGTFSNAFGDFTLRGEVGYSTDRYFLTRNSSDQDGVIKTGELGYVLGLDYQHDADFRISGQLFQSILMDRPDGTVRDRVENQATLLIEKEFLNDRLTASLLAIQSLNDGDGVVQAGVEYEYRSNVILKLGLDVFYGDRDGLFGEFGDADRITFGVEVGF